MHGVACRYWRGVDQKAFQSGLKVLNADVQQVCGASCRVLMKKCGCEPQAVHTTRSKEGTVVVVVAAVAVVGIAFIDVY